LPHNLAGVIVRWARRPGAREFRHGAAVAVAVPDLSRRDRLAVEGPPDDAAVAVREALAVVGPSYRPFGPEGLIKALVAALPELEGVASFGWMWTDRPVGRTGAEWLGKADEPEIARLLDLAAPGSYARPGVAGVERWAGVRDGGLAAVAADAWSSAEIGFLAGVAADPARRGRGRAAAACALVIDALLADHEAVALMVDGWNEPAIALYERLGLRYEPVAAARCGSPDPDTFRWMG
jgi:RimJ/RimL family protein N-acetyltransferase